MSRKRHAPDFKIVAERHRGRFSPFKDIAGSTQRELADWIREDAHQHVEGGSLAEAFQKSVRILHERRGGGFDLSDLHVEKVDKVMRNLANTARVQVDVAADDFLNRIGLQHEKKYKSGKISTTFKNHAKIHRDVYKSLDDRQGTPEYEFLRNHSNDHIGAYKHRESSHIVAAFRGTSPESMINNGDLVSDLHVAAGNIRNDSNYASYKNTIRNLLDEYGDGNVSLSGYSLGGSKVEALMQEKDLRSRLGQAVSLAGGASPLDKDLQLKATDTKISHIYHHNDMVAAAKMQHSGHHHHVLYDEADPIKSHMMLDRIAGN